jgi:outer membrane receptor for ferrienterochelin and colicins
MWVPHLAGAPGVTEDRLTKSPFFADIQFSVSRNWSLKNIPGALTWVVGVRNVLNAYQKDLDTGPDRDSNYVYGPATPRSFFMTLRWKSQGN